VARERGTGSSDTPSTLLAPLFDPARGILLRGFANRVLFGDARSTDMVKGRKAAPPTEGHIMRKIVAFEHLTLDGYVSSGQGTGFEWTHRAYSAQLAEYTQHIQEDFDLAVYGRETYLGMSGYWSAQPTADSSPTERAHAEWVNQVDKIVCSTTLESADWNNTRLVRGDLAGEFGRLKQAPGGTIAIYASPKLVHSFLALGLVDEFSVVVHPVVIGGGTPLFPAGSALDLDLLESQPFDSGAVYLRYGVA